MIPTSDVEKVVTLLRDRGQSLGLAESCTGGLLSSWVTSVAGVSDVFKGSAIAYSNEVKQGILSVSKDTLDKNGAVSKETALAMSRGALKALKVDWAVSITGIAGPGGGTPDKPVGFVCFAVVGPGLERTDQQRFEGGRLDVQEKSARHALELLFKGLTMGFDHH